MGKFLELLAPAGDKEAFLAAIENGADAVYLGGKILNARQFAGNFGSEELSEAIRYAHVRDVNVYLTMNTLVSDEELPEALNFAKEAYLLGIDAVIVQDLGFAGLLHKELPDLHLHASTQMTVYNLEGVRMLESLGFKRVVLARELSVDEIRHICKSTDLEVEVFIHGALCISYSGQCLMSSIIGGRSGNRGKCAQPCRLPYSLLKDNKTINPVENSKTETAYLLSPKDICTVGFIDKIAQTGVKSLKIEGRMKNPEYVATVVSTYRKYLNGVDNGTKLTVDDNDKRKLTQIFNRGGFSKGYFIGKTGRDIMCWEKPKNWGLYAGNVLSYTKETGLLKISLKENLSIGDGIEIWNGENESPGTVISWMSSGEKSINSAQPGTVVTVGKVKGRISKGDKVYKTSDKLLISEALESFRKPKRKTVIQGIFELKADKPAVLAVIDRQGNSVRVEGSAVPEAAVNKPLSSQRVIEQLQKTGATPFEFEKIDVHSDNNLTIPLSEINDIRRRALDELELIRGNNNRELPSGLTIPVSRQKHDSNNVIQPKISALFMTPRPELDFNSVEADRIYLPFEYYSGMGWERLSEICKSNKAQVFLWLPSITRGNYDNLIISRLNKLAESGIDGVMVGNPGSINYFKDFKKLAITGDYSLNVFNSLTLEELKYMGLAGATLSLELTLGQVRAMTAPLDFEKEIVVYGRIPLMTSEYCPVGSVTGGFTSETKCNIPCKSGNYRLKDRKGIEFPVLCDNIDCRSTILNSTSLFLADNIKKSDFSGIDYIRLNIFDETPERVQKLLKLHRQALEDFQAVKANFADVVEEIRSEGFTRGHYYRGV